MPARDDQRWNEQLRSLLAFKARHGHCEVPRFYEDGVLGHWVSNQRTLLARGRLRPERLKRLEEIGFAFSQRDDRFERFFEKLLAFRKEHGHCAVPLKFHDRELSAWVQVQRGRRDELPPDKRARLEAIDLFRSGHAAPEEIRWEQRFAELVEFKRRHGHAEVTEERCSRLLWFWTLRQRRDARRGMLAAARKARLVKMGFPFEPKLDAWEGMFERLREFRGRFGHCDVPSKLETQGLGAWVRGQRKRYVAGRLSEERAGRLAKLGFRWRLPPGGYSGREYETPEARVERLMSKLEAFRREHGHTRVPTRAWPDRELRNFVLTLRCERRAGTLQRKHQRRLDSIGFCWDAREAAWEESFEKLVAFHCTEGHANVSKVPVDHPLRTLHLWVRTQRAAFKAGALTAARRKRLEALDFQWELRRTPIEDLDAMIDRVRALPRNRRGQVLRPNDLEPDLRLWLEERRRESLERRLHPLVERELKSLGLLDDALEEDGEEKWSDWADRLGAFLRLRGGQLPPAGTPLRAWFDSQRRDLRAGMLDRDRAKRFAALTAKLAT